MIALAAIVLVAAAAAWSATSIVSPRWAGYVATGRTATPSTFTSVTGTWRQPSASCTRGSRASAAVIWVGLGGYDGTTNALEQIGSTVGCDAHGRPLSSAWFAVLPYPAHRIKLTVRPGDTLTATVTIVSSSTRLQLADSTRGWVFARTITAGLPDMTSAEWIVEPPMQCVAHACHQVQLADIDALAFTGIALTADGQVETLQTAPSVAAIVLGARESTSRGTPGSIADDGTAFTITWTHGTGERRTEREAVLPAVSRPA